MQAVTPSVTIILLPLALGACSPREAVQPGYHGVTHPHELEIIYVLEGALDHIVNGESHVLTPGMVGVVREPDVVVHRSASPEGARVLVFWPLGGEVAAFEDSGMPQTPVSPAPDPLDQS